MFISVFLQALQCVLTLVIIVAVGYLLAKKGWFPPAVKMALPRLVVMVSLPPYIFVNITGTFQHDQLLALLYGSTVPMIGISASYVLSLLLAKFMRVPIERLGPFCNGFSASNTIFIGIPVNLALFGEASLPYVLLYYFGNTLMFWSIGNYLMGKGGSIPPHPLLCRATVRSVFSPPMIAFLTGVVVLLLNIPVPQVVQTSARYLGGMTTPLALLFVGIMLHGVGLRKIHVTPDIAMVLLGRFLISPLIIILLSEFAFHLQDLMLKVFIVQASLPIMLNVSILSSYYGTDSEYGTVLVSLSTILSIATIPAYNILLAYL